MNHDDITVHWVAKEIEKIYRPQAFKNEDVGNKNREMVST